MAETLISILAIYAFIAIGFVWKKHLSPDINPKDFAKLSVYLLQPLLTFWGLSVKRFDMGFLYAPAIYLAITLGVMLLTLASTSIFLRDSKDRSILTIASVLGNTGNFGIPVGLAFFGPESLPYTTMINLGNLFFCFTFGVYGYSRGTQSVWKSFTNIFRLPILWCAGVALALNYYQIPFPTQLKDMLEIGGHASIVLQLIILGIYMETFSFRKIRYSILTPTLIIKFLLLPAIGWACMQISGSLTPLLWGVILLELATPLAVNNINLASLYNCKPKTVTELTFLTSLGALIWVPFILLFWL